MHEWRRLLPHFLFTYAGALLSVIFGDEPGRATFGGIWRASRQLPAALRSRWRARALAVVSDTEALLRPRGGHFRDRFLAPARTPERPRVLFVSPYPICPPIHGGGVFMYETLRELSKRCEVHAVVMLDYESQLEANQELRNVCASAEFFVRGAGDEPNLGSIVPNAIHEFELPDVHWLIHRQILQKQIDVIQLEYTALGQYVEPYQRLACILFEHDIYFQSIARGLPFIRSPIDKVKAQWEYLRGLRYELGMLPRCDRIQVCTPENRRFLESFLPGLAPRIDHGLRAGIATRDYRYPAARAPCIQCCFWVASGTRRTRSRSIGSCGRCCR